MNQNSTMTNQDSEFGTVLNAGVEESGLVFEHYNCA